MEKGFIDVMVIILGYKLYFLGYFEGKFFGWE